MDSPSLDSIMGFENRTQLLLAQNHRIRPFDVGALVGAPTASHGRAILRTVVGLYKLNLVDP